MNVPHVRGDRVVRCVFDLYEIVLVAADDVCHTAVLPKRNAWIPQDVGAAK